MDENVAGWEIYKPSTIEFSLNIGNTSLTGVLRASWADENLHIYNRQNSFKMTIELPSGTYAYKTLDISIISYEGNITSFKCDYSQGGWVGSPCSVLIKGGDLGDYPLGDSFTLTQGVTYDMRILL